MITMTDADYTPRFCIYSRLVHDYLKRELADPSLEWLFPRCQEGKSYPDRHSSRELFDPLPRQRCTQQICSGCAACRRRGRFEAHR